MKLLVDSDFLFGSLVDHDAHNARAIGLFHHHKQSGASFYVLDSVLQEVGTLLSHRIGMESVRSFRQQYASLGMKEIHLDEFIEKEAWIIFLHQTKKGCSFVDCANLAIIEKYTLDGILSFDTFYPKNVRITSS